MLESTEFTNFHVLDFMLGAVFEDHVQTQSNLLQKKGFYTNQKMKACFQHTSTKVPQHMNYSTQFSISPCIYKNKSTTVTQCVLIAYLQK